MFPFLTHLECVLSNKNIDEAFQFSKNFFFIFANHSIFEHIDLPVTTLPQDNIDDPVRKLKHCSRW